MIETVIESVIENQKTCLTRIPSLTKVSVDSSDGELKSGSGRSGYLGTLSSLGLRVLSATSFSFSGHRERVYELRIA